MCDFFIRSENRLSLIYVLISIVHGRKQVVDVMMYKLFRHIERGQYKTVDKRKDVVTKLKRSCNCARFLNKL